RHRPRWTSPVCRRCSNRPGWFEWTRWRNCSTPRWCSRTSHCRVVRDWGSSGTRAPSDCSLPTPHARDVRLGIEPVDIGAQAAPADFATAVRDALTSAEVDALVVVFVPPLAVPGTSYARALREAVDGAAQQRHKPVVSTFLAAEGVPNGLAVHDSHGAPARGSIPSYPSPERAVNALSRVIRYAAWRQRPKGTVVRPDGCRPELAHEIIRRALEATQ